MPELIEVEQYRACFDRLCGTTVESVVVPDARFLRGGTPTQAQRLVGTTLVSTSRRGKLLLATFANGSCTSLVGLRFGMTGRLLLDGIGPIEQLEYASPRNDPAWDRLEISLSGRVVTLRDQRLLGSFELSPDLSKLGPEGSTASVEDLRPFSRSRVALKTLLLDQSRLAGLGNLLVDEILWRAAISPMLRGHGLTSERSKVLATTIVSTVAELTERGGSHRGDTFALRRPEAVCTLCSGTMQFAKVGARGTWWCPTHQLG